MRLYFFLTFLLGSLLIFVYFRQVTRKTQTSAIAAVIVAGITLSYVFTRKYPSLENWTLFSSIIVGLWAILFVAAVVYVVMLFPCQKLWPNIFMAKNFRRIYLTLNFVYFFVALVIGSKYPKINRVKLNIPTLPNLRIVHLSDIHVDSYNSMHYLKNIVKKVNRLEPDLVAITGDMIDILPSKLDPYLAELDKMTSKLGIFFVLGNHEYYNDYRAIISKIIASNSKIIPLLNESIQLEKDSSFNVVGINDPIITPFEESLENLDYTKPSILLSHRPTVIYALPEPVDLILAGHTHNGQFFPFNLVVKMIDKYTYGLYATEKGYLYVSMGSGTWGPPIRFPRGNEIVLLEIN